MTAATSLTAAAGIALIVQEWQDAVPRRVALSALSFGEPTSELWETPGPFIVLQKSKSHESKKRNSIRAERSLTNRNTS